MGSPIFRNDQHFICTFHRVSREGIVSGDQLTEFQALSTLYYFLAAPYSYTHKAAEAFKGTVLRDRFQKCLRKLTDLGLNKGRGWFLNFSEVPLMFNRNKTSFFR